MNTEDYAQFAYAIGASDMSVEVKSKNIIDLLSQARTDKQLRTMRTKWHRFPNPNLDAEYDRVRFRKKVDSIVIEQAQLTSG